jgi:putative ABC transport system permease protein
VLDQDGFQADASGFVDGLLMFVTVMLLLAVVIALLGIVNTLALSVFERTRELGLLRAVGMTRRQVRAMVRWESVVISLIGALTGAGLGIGIGVALAHVLEAEGITGIAIPGPQIVLYVALAAVAGVLAAVGPARSAAKVDVLKAVVTD